MGQIEVIISELRVRYQTIEFPGLDLHLRTLLDNQQFEDDAGLAESLGISSAEWPIFGVLWDSAIVLGGHMLDYDIADQRVLELGCGIGLASLVLNHRGADITATDRHPSAEAFLKANVALNGGPEIPFVRTDWADHDDEIGTFDLIIGSDVLYERAHAHMLADFANRHANPTCTVILVDPGRKHGGRFLSRMEEHGFTCRAEPAEEVPALRKPFGGRMLLSERSFVGQ